MAKPLAPASRWHLPALLVALTVVLLAAFPYFEQIRSANELPRLVQAMSLVEDQEWAIDGPSRRGLALGPDLARSPVDGRLYPNKPPGASVVGAAAYELARIGGPPTLRSFTWWARLLAGVVPTVLIGFLAWGRLRPRFGPRVATATIVLGVFATPLFSYARLFYGHALAACLLYAGVVLLDQSRARAQPRQAWPAGFFGGLLAASAITVEYGAAFAGLPIAAVLLWPVLARGQDPSARRAAGALALLALLGALIPVLALASYHAAVFGSPLATGYHYAADPNFAALHGQGLLGLGLPRWGNVVEHLLSPKTGLLVWSPLALLAVHGLIRGARRTGPDADACRLQLAIFAVILFMGLSLSFQGGWRVGPRYLVVAMPMLLLGIAELIDDFREHPRGPWMLGLLAIAASWSLLANTLAATLWPHIDPSNIAEPFAAVLLPLWFDGFVPYGPASWIPHGLGLCIGAPVLLGLLTTMWAGGGDRPQRVLLPMLLGVGIGAMGLLLVLPRSIVAHPKTDPNLEYIERVYEPRSRSDGPLAGPSQRLDPR